MLNFIIILTSLLLEVYSYKDDRCETLDVIKREDWLARKEFRHTNMNVPVNHIIILHTVTRFCKTEQQCIRSVETIQDMHLDDRGWSDIAYNFLIGGDGRIYEGRGWRHRGAHSVNFNAKSIGIAFIGNYENYKPTEKMINTTLELIACGVKKGYLTPTREIHGHRDVACTLSPGKFLYAVIRSWDNYKGGLMPSYNCKPLTVPTVELDSLDY